MSREKLGEGREAEIFAWTGGRALKLYRSPDSAPRARGEADVVEALNALGAPVPRCFGIVELEGRHGVILERLDGPPMGDVIHGPDCESVVRELAALQARIHEIDGTQFTSLKRHMLGRIEHGAPPDLAVPIMARLSALPDGTRLVHSDLHPYNVVRRGDGDWVAIDWHRLYRAAPAVDVARTWFLLVQWTAPDGSAPEELAPLKARLGRIYLDHYAALTGLDRSEVDRWRVPVLAARLDEGIREEHADNVTLLRELLA